MSHRINLSLLIAEHASCIGNRLTKLQKRSVYLPEACFIPVGDFECARTLLAHRERILQGADLLNILRVRWIDQHAHRDNAISRTDPLLCQRVPACTIKDRRGILILIDYLHHHETLGGVWQRHRHRTGVEVEHRERIQRVTIGPDNALVSGRSKLTAMPEFAQGARFDDLAKIDICLGAVVVVGGDRDGWRLRNRLRQSERGMAERKDDYVTALGVHDALQSWWR